MSSTFRDLAYNSRMESVESVESVEEIDGDFGGRLVFTCEHASAALPEPWMWPDEDHWLVDTHWASDIGAAAFTRRVADLMNAPAVLSRFSRLLIDPNRPPNSETLFRENADGRMVHLNEGLLETERERRIDRFYRPYHAAVSAMVERSRGDTVFSIHTFTDNYEGEARALEIGVLFDHDDEPAHQLVHHLQEAGFHAAPNEPWSGKVGLAYSPVRHAREFERCALEIEARQDLIVEESFAARLAEALASFFS
jgi:predicted N-formylglutamate amidohydrolase